MYQSGKGYKAISKALGLQRTIRQRHYPQMEKTYNSGEPSVAGQPKLLQERNDHSPRRS